MRDIIARRRLHWRRCVTNGLAVVCLGLLAFDAGCWAAQAAQPPLLLEVKRFIVEGENPLSEQQTDALLAPYLGQHHDLNSIEAAATALENALREKGYSFYRVIVPAQRPAAGELKLRVLKFMLNELTVSGNRYFSRENILRTVPALRPGESPDVRELGRQLTLANEHPSRHVSVSIRESLRRDHLDAELKVRDVPASQTFVGLTGHTRDADNTINRNTGYTRLTVGHQQSNLFDRDHVLTLAYTTSPDHSDRVSQYGIFYWMPLYGYHTSLGAYWTKSDVDTGTVGVGGQNFNVSGRGEFWGVRAAYALPKTGEWTHSLSVAYDSKYFESGVSFAGTPLPTTTVGSRPVSLRYAARNEQPWGGVGGNIDYARNVSGGRANDAFSYVNSRTNARWDWEAWHWGLDANHTLDGRWNFVGRLRGQYTNDALIPGEQFGLGGVGSIRGLRDREATGDRGYALNLELYGPPMVSGLTPYAFLDGGYRKHVAPVAGIAPSDYASSLGVGVRWNWEKGLEANISYANVLNGITGGTPNGHHKVNFSLFYRF